MPTDTAALAQLDPTDEILAKARLATHVISCKVCAFYVHRRGNVLLVAVAGRALTRGTSATTLMDRYLQRVHVRHLEGESLTTRRRTPPRRQGGTTTITVQRACNGCGKQLGDAAAAELDTAAAGRPLPDVRLECGCWTKEQAA